LVKSKYNNNTVQQKKITFFEHETNYFLVFFEYSFQIAHYVTILRNLKLKLWKELFFTYLK